MRHRGEDAQAFTAARGRAGPPPSPRGCCHPRDALQTPAETPPDPRTPQCLGPKMKSGGFGDDAGSDSPGPCRIGPAAIGVGGAREVRAESSLSLPPTKGIETTASFGPLAPVVTGRPHSPLESAAAGSRSAPSGLAGWRRGPGRGARRVGGRDGASPGAGRNGASACHARRAGRCRLAGFARSE